jgi:hypothetical protein
VFVQSRVSLNRPAGTFSPTGGEGWDEGVGILMLLRTLAANLAQVVENKAGRQPDIIPSKPDIILANGGKVSCQPGRIYSQGDRTTSCRHKLRGLKDKPSP